MSNPRPQASNWTTDEIAESLRDHLNWLDNEHKRHLKGTAAIRLTSTGAEKMRILGCDVMKMGEEFVRLSKLLVPVSPDGKSLNSDPIIDLRTDEVPPLLQPSLAFILDESFGDGKAIMKSDFEPDVNTKEIMVRVPYDVLSVAVQKLWADLLECASQRDGGGRLISVGSEVTSIMNNNEALAAMLNLSLPSNDAVIPSAPKNVTYPKDS